MSDIVRQLRHEASVYGQVIMVPNSEPDEVHRSNGRMCDMLTTAADHLTTLQAEVRAIAEAFVKMDANGHKHHVAGPGGANDAGRVLSWVVGHDDKVALEQAIRAATDASNALENT